jgi:hypothetical protein
MQKVFRLFLTIITATLCLLIACSSVSLELQQPSIPKHKQQFLPYPYVSPNFSNGLNVVMTSVSQKKKGDRMILSGEIGIIDRTGKLLSRSKVTTDLEPFDRFDIKEGLLPFKDSDCFYGMHNSTGYMDVRGKIVVKPHCGWEGFYAFSEGLSAQYVPVGSNLGSGWGFIDKSGNFAIQPQFVRGQHSFSEGLAFVVFPDFSAGYIDHSGKIVIEPKFRFSLQHQYDAEFSEGMASVLDGNTNKVGYIDSSGEFVIAPQFDRASHFSEGLALVTNYKLNRGQRYIDTNGNVAIPDFFSRASNFSEGLAGVFPSDEKGEGCGYIEPSGKFVIKPKFSSCGDFHEGIAAVNVGYDKFPKRGYIDASGKFLIEPQSLGSNSGWMFNGVLVIECIFDKQSKYMILSKSEILKNNNPKYQWCSL